MSTSNDSPTYSPLVLYVQTQSVRLPSELAEANQTRLVSVRVPCPRSLIQDWVAWQGIVHLRNELTGEAERLLRGKAKAQMAWIILT